MEQVVLVALGGAVGAAGRYGLSLAPWKGAFPGMTLLTNLLGAVCIGFLAGLALRQRLDDRWLLFWKTGVCGGFTTFSTFSLETVGLLEQGRYGLGTLYVLASVILCLLGVAVGRGISLRLFPVS